MTDQRAQKLMKLSLSIFVCISTLLLAACDPRFKTTSELCAINQPVRASFLDFSITAEEDEYHPYLQDMLTALQDPTFEGNPVSAEQQLALDNIDDIITLFKTERISYKTPELKSTELENAFDLFIEDDGPGIDPALQKRVFERFYRVDSSRSRNLGGTGLGLSIVKHIVQKHNGTISIFSNELGGVSFKITIPQSTSV